MNLYNTCQEKGKEYFYFREKLNDYISNFFLDEGMGVTVSIRDDPFIEIFYNPQRNKCYIMQKESFYQKVSELCKDLDLLITYKESRTWEDTVVGVPFFHRETVFLKSR